MLQFISEPLVRRLSNGLRLRLGRVHDVRGAATAGVEVAFDRGTGGRFWNDLLVGARDRRDVLVAYVGCACFVRNSQLRLYIYVYMYRKDDDVNGADRQVL